MSFADRRLHLVGAGGAGVSALAVVAYAWGAEVSGCDRAESPYLRQLDRFGIPVTVGHDPAHLFPGMEVVASGALPADHSSTAPSSSPRWSPPAAGRCAWPAPTGRPPRPR